MKKIILTLFFTTLSILFFNTNTSATSINLDEVYLTPGGQTIGIEVDTSVVIVDTYSVKNHQGYVNPAKEAGIQKGDIIITVDGKRINKITDLKSELLKYNNGHNKPLNMIVKRDGRLYNKKIYPVRTRNNTLSLGLYLKDNIVGIGTLTFIYEGKYFGALGHPILDRNLGVDDVRDDSGFIKNAKVTSITKSTRGNPGEKKAHFSSGTIGEISKNSTTGIYGELTEDISSNRKMKIAKQEEVRLGDAKILTVIEGDKVEQFDIKIVHLEKQTTKSIKGIKIQITDERLLNETGGIIQGMSGSPIIQNNKIVGAVTHVLIDDSTTGYGIYIEYMLADLDI